MPSASVINKKKFKAFEFNTLSLHSGQKLDKEYLSRAQPIYQTTSYVFENAKEAGLIDEVVDSNILMETAFNKAKDLATMGHPSYSMTKELYIAEPLKKIKYSQPATLMICTHKCRFRYGTVSMKAFGFNANS